MAPRKLSESDKQEILSAYRQSDETTSTLAGQYSVSISTISRILKQSLPEEEYEALMHQKRSGASRIQIAQDLLPGIELDLTEDLSEDLPDESSRKSPDEVSEELLQDLPDEFLDELSDELPDESFLPSLRDFAEDVAPVRTDAKPKPPQLRQNKRSLSREDPEEQSVPSLSFDRDALAPSAAKPQVVSPSRSKNILKPSDVRPSTALTHPLDGLARSNQESLENDLEDDLEDLDDDDLDSSELDDDDLDDDADLGDEETFAGIQVRGDRKIQVLPLSEADIPHTCYVVVDRASELITRPLKDFAELGQIPTEEIQEKTLPIFDNHRIAKRFLRRMQRVVKVPDGQILKKVGPYLQAKGITRLLIDGQVYSL